MRIKLFATIITIMLLGGCSKNNTVINFNCLVNGTSVNGNAVTFYNNTAGTPTFQVTMSGPNISAVTIVWYNINTLADEANITDRSYTMPANPMPPLTVSGSYAGQLSSAIYNTGTGNKLDGNVTVTKNTGPGGVISGTFYFNGLNSVNSLDTVHITQGTFTSVPVVTS